MRCDAALNTVPSFFLSRSIIKDWMFILMEILNERFGFLPDGREVRLITLKAGELSLSVSCLGAALRSLLVPSSGFGIDDVLLGCDGFEGCVSNRYFFGVTVGRFANRISGARFSLDGKEYKISENKPGCSLHGGTDGFSKRLWKAQTYHDGDGVYVRLELESPDGDQGYPGNVTAAVTYGLTKDNRLKARFEARSDAPCPINLTNHSYFNLAGHNRGTDVLSTQARLFCSSYVEVDDNFIPTGRIASVEGTPLYFRAGKPIGQDIAPLCSSPLGGYDHCLVVDGYNGELRPFGEFWDPLTGRSVRGFTTQPGIQFFTGNMLNSVSGKDGAVYEKHFGFCIEPEFFPDSPNQPGFPPAVFGPGRDYCENAELAFDW